MTRELDIAATVATRLRAFLADTAADPLDLRAVVAKFGALPMILDMSGCYALQADGEVVSFAWDEPHGLAVVTDERLCAVALHQGSLKYPELEALVPARPPTAVDCSSCGGTGTPSSERRPAPNVVCLCGGLGWIPSGR